jgi:hypothetical protein
MPLRERWEPSQRRSFGGNGFVRLAATAEICAAMSRSDTVIDGAELDDRISPRFPRYIFMAQCTPEIAAENSRNVRLGVLPRAQLPGIRR